jgi:hypothetical protein
MKKRIGKIEIYEAYNDEVRRKAFTASVLTFSYSMFQSALIIKRLDEITAFYQDENHNKADFPKKFPEVLVESLIDYVRISISFENYFKAKLLLNGFIVNNIKDKSLYKEQKDRPIKIDELIPNNSVNELSILKDKTNEQTINYNILLRKDEYKKIFNMNKPIIHFLSIINKQRNRLHLYSSGKITLNKAYLNNYAELKKIVERDIALLQNTLLDETAPTSRSRLPIKC